MENVKEFFNRRTFEVVWAAFRVAEAVSRPTFRRTLEDMALAYLSHRDEMSLAALKNAISLGEKIGEISPVNTRVLLRETGNLEVALENLAIAAQVELPDSGKRDVDITGIFSSPAMPEVQSPEKSGKESGKGYFEKTAETDAFPENKGFSDIKVRQGLVATDRFGNASAALLPDSGKSDALRAVFSGESPAKSGNSPAIVRQSPERSGNGFEDARQTEGRKKVILEMLGRRAMCHISDLIEAMPEVSQRTLRNDVRRLVRDGLAERIGSGGPNSFFRLKQRV